jgi:hypothetical protein
MPPAASPRPGQPKYAERHLKLFVLKKIAKKTRILKKKLQNQFLYGRMAARSKKYELRTIIVIANLNESEVKA